MTRAVGVESLQFAFGLHCAQFVEAAGESGGLLLFSALALCCPHLAIASRLGAGKISPRPGLGGREFCFDHGHGAAAAGKRVTLTVENHFWRKGTALGCVGVLRITADCGSPALEKGR